MNPWARLAIPGALIVLFVFLAYLPALRGGFISDDDMYVTNDPLLTAPDGLKRIWFSTGSPSQYFPLTYTTFRIERALWGLNPGGYHRVNILLHVMNALLVWRLLKRLSVPGAWLAAAIFALHPVQVESVAWIAECKNVLMCLFFLLALLAWIEFVEDRPKPLWRYYLLSLLFYGLALCSKTTACTLPAALLLILWSQRKPINRQRLMQIAPFLLMGVGMGLVTVWWEQHHQGTQGKLFAMGLLERVLVASHAVWFYSGKLVWPANLTFSYPRWTINPTEPLAYGWLVAGAGLGGAIYFARRFVGRGVEVAALFYVATLSPLLGFIMLYTFRYTFVADHYQYVASIGPLALAAAGISLALGRFEKRSPFLKPVFCGVLLLVLGVLTWRQSATYVNRETLWRTTLARNPNCCLAYNNLGIVLAARGRFDEAIENYRQAIQINPNLADALNNLGTALVAERRFDEAIENYRQAIQIDPNDAKALNNLGNALATKGQFDEAIGNFRQAIQINPNLAGALNNLGTALVARGRFDEAIESYRQAIQIDPNDAKALRYLGNALAAKGRFDEAIENYRQAIQIDPNDAKTLSNLAWVLATSPDDELRNGTEAVRLAERACELTHYGQPLIIGTLAAAYAESGRFPEAVTTAEKAEQLATNAGLKKLAGATRQLLELYRAGKPYHESPPAASSSLQTPSRRAEQ